MVRFRLYIATSVDGYIATPDGAVEWLAPFQEDDFAYEAFEQEIRTLVIGRRTYDQVRAFGVWPYAGKRVVVLTSSDLGRDRPEGVLATADAATLVSDLDRSDEPDVWIVGGARTIRSFLDLDAVDMMDIFVMPVLLGEGVPLFTPSSRGAGLALIGSEAYPSGAVRLTYGRA